MKISILTVFPELYETFLKTSLIGRACEKKLVDFNVVRFSDFCKPGERIDGPSCGHGCGMIIRPEVVEAAIEFCEKKCGKSFKIFFSPQGKKLDQKLVQELATQIFPSVVGDEQSKLHPDPSAHSVVSEPVQASCDHLLLVCSRYEGMDERVEFFHADEIISLGDFVVMGGDLPAQIFLEGILRLLPGVVGKCASVIEESFGKAFLDYPHYTLPVEWHKMKVPDVLRSGDHAAIEKWRKDKAAKKTVLNKFDWLRSHIRSKEDCDLSRKFIPNHYVALMHTQVLVKGGRIGDTSITSIDIHDIARSSSTYGISNFFITSRLEDQHMIMKTFLDFWESDEGKKYNPSRFHAIARVVPTKSLEEVLSHIEKKEGKNPIIIATSAQSKKMVAQIDYFSQGLLWEKERPILFLFGTGQGLCDEIVQKSDFLLSPVQGLVDYNHLSVRSAVAVVLDRWLGKQEKL